MMHTSKMILVPSEMAQKDKATETLMSSLDKEMQSILKNSSLPADAKLAQYSQVLHRYMKTSDESRKPLKIEVQEPEPLPKIPDDAEILADIPKKLEKQALSLLSHVKQNPNIQWSKNNELIVDGVKFEGSHIIDLIHDFTRAKKVPAIGAEAFARALLRSNVPREVIGNRQRLKLFEKPVMIGTPLRTSTPIGKVLPPIKMKKDNSSDHIAWASVGS